MSVCLLLREKLRNGFQTVLAFQRAYEPGSDTDSAKLTYVKETISHSWQIFIRM